MQHLFRYVGYAKTGRKEVKHMKFKITETREFIIEAESFEEAEEKYMEMVHGADEMNIEQIT